MVVTKHNGAETAIVDELIQMHQRHARRSDGKKNYTAFSGEYVRSLITNFGDMVGIRRAQYEGTTEAMVLTVRFGQQTVYYIGASDIRHPKFSPAYLCQWEAIKHAQSQ